MAENLETTEPREGGDLQAVLDVLAERASSYRMFARLFLSPLSADEIDGLAAMQLEDTAREMGDDSLLARGFNDMGRGLHRRHSGTQRLLGTDFTMCFDGISSLNDERAMPYASMFISAKTGKGAELFQAPRKADRAAYRRENVQADPALHLPDDHLSFELSFMADLSQKMAAAVQAGDLNEALRLAGASDEFRTGHILTWYDKFYDLALRIIETRFYRGVLEAVYGYLSLDAELLADVRAALAA